jgi:hypothetical protein
MGVVRNDREEDEEKEVIVNVSLFCFTNQCPSTAVEYETALQLTPPVHF